MNDPTLWQVPPILGSGTLRQEIAGRLSKYGSPSVAQSQELSGVLGGIRALFTDPYITRFNDDLRAGVMAVLTDPWYGFDPNAMLRFRSSTNVEDSADYTAAGLFASFGGCLADDRDGDNRGPCLCDPNTQEERGVFQAIRQTFASFYDDNAFLERRHRDVNEALVGMAMVVHHSFPNELANGVATFDCKVTDSNTTITLVTQLGEVSVTNPPDASTPEMVVLKVTASGTVAPVPANIKTGSSLVPLGGTVMTWSSDYKTLAGLLIQVSKQYAQVTGRTTYLLDMEYKKVPPGDKTLPSGGLVIKQVRPLPTADQTPTITPFLIKGSMEFEVFPGECELLEDRTDVFADHRLKSRWDLETRTMILDANDLAGGIYGQMTVEYLDEDTIRTVTEPMSSTTQHAFAGTTASDTWRWADLATGRTYQLRTTRVPTAVSSVENPILMLADLGTNAYTPYRVLTLDVSYDDPVMAWFQSLWPSALGWTTTNRVYLWPRQSPSSDDIPQERSFAANGISIVTSFYYPPLPSGYTTWVGSTAPLKRWKQTVIEGLTTEPIVLSGYYSQTCRAEHHNLIENFLFEPRLEPGISTDVLAELRAQNIRFIHLMLDNEDSSQSKITTHGF